jgi:hypothetical protein
MNKIINYQIKTKQQMEKEDLFGEAQKESATYGEWSQKITPQQAFPLKDGSATITIDQNYKVGA